MPPLPANKKKPLPPRERDLTIAIHGALNALNRQDIKAGPKIAIAKRYLRNAL